MAAASPSDRRPGRAVAEIGQRPHAGSSLRAHVGRLVSPRARRTLPPTPLAALLGALCLTAFMAAPARAEFTICNQSLDVFNVAIGYDHSDGFQTEGWWVVGANRCVDLITEPLSSRYVYVHVEDVFGRNALHGAVRACVGEGKFSIRDAKDCWQRGFIEASFAEVDTKEQERWTYILGGE